MFLSFKLFLILLILLTKIPFTSILVLFRGIFLIFIFFVATLSSVYKKYTSYNYIGYRLINKEIIRNLFFTFMVSFILIFISNFVFYNFMLIYIIFKKDFKSISSIILLSILFFIISYNTNNYIKYNNSVICYVIENHNLVNKFTVKIDNTFQMSKSEELKICNDNLKQNNIVKSKNMKINTKSYYFNNLIGNYIKFINNDLKEKS